MPKHHTPAVLFIPVLLAGLACSSAATAQITSTFTDSGQALGNGNSYSVALGDLDGDGDLDALVGNWGGPNTVWTNTVTGTGVCCAPSGCAVVTENLSGLCEQLGGVYLPNGSCDDCPATCPGDLNHDGTVDGIDLAIILGAWGVCP